MSAHPTSPSRSPEERPAAPPSSGLTQPVVGLIGLVIVAVVFWLLAMASGAEHSLLVFGPITTFALPVLAMIALWWDGWPGTRSGRALGGLINTVLLVAAGLVLTFVGLAITGKPAVSQVFGTAEATDPSLPSFPFTMPLAATVFVIFLQLTFVNRKWPFDRLSAVPAGLAAFATAWVLGVVIALLVPNWTGFLTANAVPAEAVEAMGLRDPAGPVDALQWIALLLCIVVWQMGIFFLLQGKPVSMITNKAGYLVAANATTLVGGWLTWLVLSNVLDGADKAVPTISAMAGVWVAGTLVAGLLLEGWPARLAGRWAGVGLLGTALAVAAVLYYLLLAIGDAFTWTKAPVELWVSIGGLNFLGAVVIVHAVLWRRWPVPAAPAPAPPE